ncbi:MAG: hypothetical protein JXR95_00960 [Deltaproteobacteria bacterium]|nr:hypothetical protein [Deltaproteobacteria bacterium]
MSDYFQTVLKSLPPITHKRKRKKLGQFRVFIVVLVIVLSSVGAAFVSAILIYRQSIQSIEIKKLKKLVSSTVSDNPSNYTNAIYALDQTENTYSMQQRVYLKNKFIVFLMMSHGRMEFIKYFEKNGDDTRKVLYENIYKISSFLLSGKYSDAAFECEKAMARFPGEPLVYYLSGKARVELGNYEAAKISLGIAVELDKKYSIPYEIELARLELYRAKYGSAIKILNKILQKNPSHILGNQFLKLILTINGKNSEISDSKSMNPLIDAVLSTANGLIYLRNNHLEDAFRSCVSGWEKSRIPQSLECTVRSLMKMNASPEKLKEYLSILEENKTPDRKRILAVWHVMRGESLIAAKILKKEKSDNYTDIILKISADLDDGDTIRRLCKNISDKNIYSCLWASWRSSNWSLLKSITDKHKLNYVNSFFIDHDRIAASQMRCSDEDMLCLTVKFMALMDLWKWNEAGKLLDSINKPLFQMEKSIYMSMYSERTGRFSVAFKQLDVLSERNLESPVQLYDIAKLLYKLEQNETARYLAQKIRKLQAVNYRAPLILATYHKKKHQYRLLKKDLDEIALMKQKDPVVSLFSGSFYLHSGEYKRMLTVLRDAIKQTQYYPKYYYLASLMLLKSSNFPMAVILINEMLEKAVGKKDTALFSYYLAKFITKIDKKEMRDAKFNLIARLEEMPMVHPFALEVLAKHYHSLDIKNGKSVQYMKRAVELAPQAVELRLRLAEYLMQSNSDRAVFHLRTILRDFSFHSAAFRARKLLRESRNP